MRNAKRITNFSNHFLLGLCLVGRLTVCQVKPTSAQDSSASTNQFARTALGSEAEQNQRPEQANENKAEEKDKQRRGSIIVAPLPIVSPAIGNGIVPIVAYIFPIQTKDKISPPSVVAAAGLITSNGTRAFAVGGELFMKENRYELKLLICMAT